MRGVALLLPAALAAVALGLLASPASGSEARVAPDPPAAVARVLAASFPAPEQRREARCVAYAESAYRRTAVSRTADYGLFQINYAAHHLPGESRAAFGARMFDLDRNARYAAHLSRGGRDWHAWSWRTRARCGV
jgi:Lysozyme like domain